LLDIESETCKIVLSSESIDFRSTVIKSFLIESINENVQSTSEIEDIQPPDHQNNLPAATSEITRSPAITRSTRARRLSLRYQNFADIIVFLQDDDSHSNLENSSSPTPTFTESRRKEINDLLKKRVFELIIIVVVLRNVRIFNFRFVDEIKHSDISDVYEKFRLVIQTYNDHDKTLMLTQSSTIQRMSQRIILALTACIMSDCHLYLRDITQAYVQSKTSLNRQFFIRPPSELNLSKNSILRVVKPLYEVLETETH
jgi:Cu2+-containing amine oxidase